MSTSFQAEHMPKGAHPLLSRLVRFQASAKRACLFRLAAEAVLGARCTLAAGSRNLLKEPAVHFRLAVKAG